MKAQRDTYSSIIDCTRVHCERCSLIEEQETPLSSSSLSLSLALTLKRDKRLTFAQPGWYRSQNCECNLTRWLEMYPKKNTETEGSNRIAAELAT